MKVKLKELGVISTGNTPSKNISEFYDSKDIGFVKPDIISDAQINYIVTTTEYISEAARAKARIVSEDAVFVTCIGSIGKIGIAKGKELAFNQQINAIEPNEKILPKYLAYSILANKKKLEAIANAPVVPIINKTQFGEFEIDITDDVNEQERITKLLDKVSALILDRKTELKKFDDLVKARFVEMFGDLGSPDCKWNCEKLVDVCASSDDIKCGPFGTQLSKDEYVDTGVAVWEIPQINSFFATKPTHYLTEEKARQLDAYSIKPGDIAMSRKGNVGKCAVFPSDFKAGIIHSDVLRIRVDDSRVLPLFMMHQLHYSGAVQHQIKLVSSGAIMAGINVTKLKQILVYIPPIELQTQFIDFVHQVDKSKAAVQKALDEVQLLFDSLMQKYFG